MGLKINELRAKSQGVQFLSSADGKNTVYPETPVSNSMQRRNLLPLETGLLP